ncbi:hypothetical protein P153DRAFT_379275 [Dothidotthia symphoricarpi CBS 119687]|uniref:Uncharacterized protein n=1 Tax=Dothidotthia symphoricarpi CBS 119687 TaxID=1392245 RepID=A0A6A6A1N9_9PLEO|nr:uncharacterized protein P153DRAFT_379275 [Dothidotthia symphoricarpi CBS 119687]KAF2124638.1 hypothetical protein P153DRAFT_379275 [Dothidotthia symphoricarpi CBS 119687]
MLAPVRTRPTSTLSKPGYEKIVKTCEVARERYKLDWVWIDTCCIDKTSSSELSEAINSMFKWYRSATVCLVYLADVNVFEREFVKSRWFRRGWTLQELIAPRDVVFFDCGWVQGGTKKSMAGRIAATTGISTSVLTGARFLSTVPVAARMSWAALRETTKEEDLAYCLLGIFSVNMPMLYGEGAKAFIRLQEEIMRNSADLSIFLWEDSAMTQKYTGLLSRSPTAFYRMGKVAVEPTFSQREFLVTNRGIRLKLGLHVNAVPSSGLAVLPLGHVVNPSKGSLGIYLRRAGLDLFVRTRPKECFEGDINRMFTKFQVVKSLHYHQSVAMWDNRLVISNPLSLPVSSVEPPGCWDPKHGIVYSGFSGAFLGYIEFELSAHDKFAVVFCHRDHVWSCDVVQGQKWAQVQKNFQSHYMARYDRLIYAQGLLFWWQDRRGSQGV